MRRLVFAVATALSAVVGAAFLATGPATAHADDNATVCSAARQKIDTGAQGIVSDLQKAASQAAQGDTAGADATVKTLGPKLDTIGRQLQQVAGTATDQNLRDALAGFATTLSKLGQSLTSLDSLRSVDEGQLKKQAQQLQNICGFTPGPGASSVPFLNAPS